MTVSICLSDDFFTELFKCDFSNQPRWSWYMWGGTFPQQHLCSKGGQLLRPYVAYMPKSMCFALLK